MAKMLITTTDLLEGYEIEEYLGLVSSETVVGIDIFSEFVSGFTDVMGGRSKTLEDEINKTNRTLLQTLQVNARRMGANAIIGYHRDLEEMAGKNKQMFMMSCYGTAVKVKSTQTQKTIYYFNQNEVMYKSDVEKGLTNLKELYSKKQTHGYAEILDNILPKIIYIEDTDLILELLKTVLLITLNIEITKVELYLKLLFDQLTILYKENDEMLFYQMILDVTKNHLAKFEKNIILKDNILKLFVNYVTCFNISFTKENCDILKQLPSNLIIDLVLPSLWYMKNEYCIEDKPNLENILYFLNHQMLHLRATDEKGRIRCVCQNIYNKTKCPKCNRDDYGLTTKDYEYIDLIKEKVTKILEIF